MYITINHQTHVSADLWLKLPTRKRVCAQLMHGVLGNKPSSTSTTSLSNTRGRGQTVRNIYIYTDIHTCMHTYIHTHNTHLHTTQNVQKHLHLRCYMHFHLHIQMEMYMHIISIYACVHTMYNSTQHAYIHPAVKTPNNVKHCIHSPTSLKPTTGHIAGVPAKPQQGL